MSRKQNRQNLTIDLIEARKHLNEEAGDRQADHDLGHSIDADTGPDSGLAPAP